MFVMTFWKRKKINISEAEIPKHIGIIMDGNGRWASKRGLPRSAGHRAGSKKLKEITRACGELGVEVLTVYAFSTENWRRPKTEVNFLMQLLLEYLKNAEKEIGGDNVKIKVIGDISAFSDEIQNEIARVEQLTAGKAGCYIALNYGGRYEITQKLQYSPKSKKWRT